MLNVIFSFFPHILWGCIDVQFFQNHLSTSRSLLSPLNCLYTFVANQQKIPISGSIPVFCVLSHWSVLSTFSPIPCCLDSYSFIISLKVRVSPLTVFLLRSSVGCVGSVVFYKLQIQFIDIHKVTSWGFDCFVLHLCIRLGKTEILAIMCLSVHRT